MRDPLESGIGFSVLGDSISTLRGWNPKGWRVHYEGEARIAGVEQPDDTWWGRVISELGGRLVANSSLSGSTVEGFGFPAGESDERIEALAPGGALPDAVLVFMGINDYGWGGALNQVLGGSVSASARWEDLAASGGFAKGADGEGGSAGGGSEEAGPKGTAGERGSGGSAIGADALAGTVGPQLRAGAGIADDGLAKPLVAMTIGRRELERFRRAYSAMLQKVRRLAPDAEVWCVTLAPGTEKPASCARSASTEPGSVETGSAEPGSAKTRSASSAGESLPATSTVGCYKYSIRGVPLDDCNRAIREAAAQNGAHVADVRAFGVCYDAVDGVHPSASGMRQLAAMVLAQMRGLPADPSLVPELAAAQRARRTCSRLGCAGCEFADADPSSWTLCCAGPDR